MIKHSKYKNTGVLFELLVRQATSDLMSNKDPKAVKIFKKYFTNTELGKEYNLYSSVLNSPKLNETKAEILVTTIVEQAKKLDRVKLDKEKYNLIKEIKKHYDLDNFFKAKIETYKIYASIYTLVENQISTEVHDTKQIITNKLTLLEHITKESLTERKVASKVVEEFMKDNISDTTKLRTYLNTKLLEVKTEITSLKATTKDKVLQIKLNEVLNFIKPMSPNESIKDEVLIGLMQYYQLISELKATN